MENQYNAALEFIERAGPVSFVDLEKQHPWMFEKGSELGIRCQTIPNLWMWVGMSSEGIAFFEPPETIKRIEPTEASYQAYAYDGKAPGLPLAGNDMTLEGYAEPHWLPTNWIARHA